MEFKGTKGNWKLSKSKKGDYFFLSGDNWTNFARVVRKMKGSIHIDKEGKANAKLIEAAPELLKALIELTKANPILKESNYHQKKLNALKAIEKALL